MKPRIVDMFCKAGGGGMGYHRAGFDVLGVDIEPQPNYPFEFVQADALTFPLAGFDAAHASPPCQAHTQLRAVNDHLGRRDDHRDLIPATRERLEASGLPYVIENVVGAPLRNPVRLCGSAFRYQLGRPLRRHRLFETNWPLLVPPCDHSWQTERRYWTGWRPGGERRLSAVVQVYGNAGGREHWNEAMGIDWMTPAELTQAIPPVYTEHIGCQLLAHLACT